jgi:1,4-dihydroxy-2-naphthoyl-CoA hydrolase
MPPHTTAAVAGRAPSRPNLRELPREDWPSVLSAHFATGLSGWLDYEILSIEPGRAEARLELRDELLMRSGDYLHAGTVVAFADSVAGYASLASLPERAKGFTTAELKVNLVATTGAGDALLAVATLVHGGRTTQVWDVVVSREQDDRPIGHFRATQYLLEDER